jgi:ZIP family zinc transporter
MESGSLATRAYGSRWRLWTLVPLVLLVAAVSLFAARGDSLLGLLGENPPPADQFDVRRVQFEPGQIRVRVTNPQPDRLTIALVTVDDAVVPYELDGEAELERLRSRTITIPYDWVDGEPIAVGITSSSGIQTVEEIPAATRTPVASAQSFLGYGLVGLLVGVVPVALGLLWLPSLRRTAPEWLSAFMALTAGLLVFLALEALSEAVELQAALPGAFGGVGVVLLGFASSFLLLTLLSRRLGGAPSRAGGASGLALATLVAVGIGLHNLGEGLAIGSSFALGELTLGTFLIVGFMVHNVTEGLGIATPASEESRPPSLVRLAVLTLIAGGPAILGAWIGGFVNVDLLGVLFFAAAAGAAFEVVAEVVRYLSRRPSGGLGSPYVVGGFLAGLAIMYGTGVLVG